MILSRNQIMLVYLFYNFVAQTNQNKMKEKKYLQRITLMSLKDFSQYLLFLVVCMYVRWGGSKFWVLHNLCNVGSHYNAQDWPHVRPDVRPTVHRKLAAEMFKLSACLVPLPTVHSIYPSPVRSKLITYAQ